MKVIFAGPTLYGVKIKTETALELRPPARQGDIYKATQDGANVIGLIDGVYEQVPAVWHKEILYGLSKGVRIFGAASMGAIRAAECHAFGMIGVGEIYQRFAHGDLEDDADVAQSHGPSELGFLPLSEPMVNVEATLTRCLTLALISPQEHDRLAVTARAIFFKDRTYRRIVENAVPDRARAGTMLSDILANAINPKLDDTWLLLEAVRVAPDNRSTPPTDWDFASTHMWRTIFP